MSDFGETDPHDGETARDYLVDVFCMVSPWIDDMDEARELTHVVLSEAIAASSPDAFSLDLSFVHRIARRKVREHLSSRTPKRYGFHLHLLTQEEGEEERHKLSSALALPESKTESHYDLLRSIFCMLDPDQRASLWLHHVEGLSYKEISAVIGRSVKAIDTMLFRAKKKIRDRYEGSNRSAEDFYEGIIPLLTLTRECMNSGTRG